MGNGQNAAGPPKTKAPVTEIADNHMRALRPGEALLAYQNAWSQLPRDATASERVWLLMALANAAIRQGDFEEAYAALSALPRHYAETGIVVGNPLFHLLVGLALHGLNDSPDVETDNFARALICGGPDIFSGEDPAHLERNERIASPAC